MGLEIERRFRVLGDEWRSLAEGVDYVQGYLNTEKERTVRVRIVGNDAWLTIKGFISDVSRHEFEYAIPVDEAKVMLKMCPLLVEKKRHKIMLDGHLWEVDEFFGVNKGLVVAEIELTDESEVYTKPVWIGEELTYDSRFTNAYLSKQPYSTW